MSMKALCKYATPLRAVDQVTQIHQSGISTTRALLENEDFFKGHFPGYHIFPGVFLIEAVHQAVLRYAETYWGTVTLSEIVSARFLSPVRPGDLLEIDCACGCLERGDELLATATIRCVSRKVASIKMTYRLENN